jgi:hypothetical protein
LKINTRETLLWDFCYNFFPLILTDFDVRISVEELEALFEAPETAVDALEKPPAGLSSSMLEWMNTVVLKKTKHFFKNCPSAVSRCLT